MKITIVAGARPNFMKIAPIIDAITHAKQRGNNMHFRLVHTGQHYDKNMSGSFFEQLGIPDPDSNLKCGGGTQAEQTASIMIEFEKDLKENPSDLVIVVGDVTSTLACSIVAKKMCTKVAHVEGGIRSGDITMPEEVNRIVTDSIADYFFTTSEFANTNLKAIGVPVNKIFFVGNTMIDTLLKNIDRLKKPVFYDTLALEKGNFLVLTLHRPSNVDEESTLAETILTITDSVKGLPIVFPVHPRTAKGLTPLLKNIPNLYFTQPQGYLEFNYLVKNCKCVITDSGGITEETTVLGVPCITLRETTERPETITMGTNELVGTKAKDLTQALDKLFAGKWKQGVIPPLWDGKAGDRIIKHILDIYS